MIREAWLKIQERKRNLRSWALVIAAYGLAVFGLWLSGQFKIEDISEFSGPLKVKLGAISGVEEAEYLFNQSKEEAPPEQIEQEETSPEELPDSQQKIEDDVSDKTIAMDVSPSPTVAPTKKPTPKPSPKVSSSPTPRRSAQPSPKVSPVASPSAAPIKTAAPDTTVVVKGKEQGNAYETNLDAGSSVVGRGLYVPIYLYMPIPYEVSSALFSAISDSKDGLYTADERKGDFKKFYSQAEGVWRLKNPVPLDDRPRLWIMLQESGYRLGDADYKKGKYLRPVVISFKVSASKGGSSPALLEIKLDKSSGYSDIDEAVMYGFKKAAFYNNGERSVSGRFTYSFE